MPGQIDFVILGAMDTEVADLSARLEHREDITVGASAVSVGKLFGKSVAVCRCGVGKVFAAMASEALISAFSPKLLINTGVGGALDASLVPGDIVVSDRLVQHDMDTSAVGDPVGLVSGINRIWFESDARAREILLASARKLSLRAFPGNVATGDTFIAARAAREAVLAKFSASVCEMEAAAAAQVAYMHKTPFIAIRAISDSFEGNVAMEYSTFKPIASARSAALTLALIERY